MELRNITESEPVNIKWGIFYEGSLEEEFIFDTEDEAQLSARDIDPCYEDGETITVCPVYFSAIDGYRVD